MSSPFKSNKAKKGLRWSPPKPKVTYGTLDKLLRRHLTVPIPEARLVTAVIARAIADGIHRDPHIRTEARRFLQGRRLECWCDGVGLDPNAVREIAVKAGYLPPEDDCWVQPGQARKAPAANTKPSRAKRRKRTQDRMGSPKEPSRA